MAGRQDAVIDSKNSAVGCHQDSAVLESFDSRALVPTVGHFLDPSCNDVVHRFRRRSQFWAYCGLAIVMCSLSDWFQTPDGRWIRAVQQQARGLNKNHNSILKSVFKGTATTVINQHKQSSFAQSYRLQLAEGMKPNLAKLILARRIAATVLAMWKHEEVYDPNRRTLKTM